MTNQEIFDKVWKHFIVEDNPRSLSPGGTCLYRGPNGARCAVGLFIPDKEYRDVCEGWGVFGFKHTNHNWIRTFTYEQVELLEHLQDAHDRTPTVNKSFKQRLQAVATLYNLEVAEEGAS